MSTTTRAYMEMLLQHKTFHEGMDEYDPMCKLCVEGKVTITEEDKEFVRRHDLGAYL